MSGWLVTGAGGMLGRDLVTVLADAGERVLPYTHAELDVTDERAVAATLAAVRPAVVVNCAAWTDVDGAERAESAAHRLNAHAPRYLARACAETGARLLHLSTDYVFDGAGLGSGADAAHGACAPHEAGATGRLPYPEAAPTAPRTAYGRTKLAGEQGVLTQLPTAGAVVRTAWLYGRHGRNFVRTMAERARAGAVVDVVEDQHGQPTWTRDVARHLYALGRAATPATGVYHSTSAGHTTWYALAREVYRRCGADPALVRPLASGELTRVAPRPAWSVLAHRRRSLGHPGARDWLAALDEAFAHVAPEATQTPPGTKGPGAVRPVRASTAPDTGAAQPTDLTVTSTTPETTGVDPNDASAPLLSPGHPTEREPRWNR